MLLWKPAKKKKTAHAKKEPPKPYTPPDIPKFVQQSEKTKAKEEELVALMCYLQISLLGVAGYVKVGNSLTDPITDGDSLENYWFTPMYFSDFWCTRRIIRRMQDILESGPK